MHAHENYIWNSIWLPLYARLPLPFKAACSYHDMQWNHFWSLKVTVLCLWSYGSSILLKVSCNRYKAQEEMVVTSVPFIKLFLIESIFLLVYIISALCWVLWTGSFSRINLTCEFCWSEAANLSMQICELKFFLLIRCCFTISHMCNFWLSIIHTHKPCCKRYSWPCFLLALY